MDNKTIVAAFFTAAAANDQAAMAAILDPEVVVTEAESLPFGGRHVGFAAFQALVRRVFLLWRDTRVDVERLIGDGQYVVVLATMHARSKADDAALSMPIAEVWRLENGRVKEIRPFYFDTRKFVDVLEESSSAAAR
jgi:hypothetical protein